MPIAPPGPAAASLCAILGVLLLTAAWTDIRSRIIPNPLNAAIALMAPLFWWAQGLAPWPDMAAQLALGIAVFALFAGFFWLGLMGGGDVKMIGALALWLPLFDLVRASPGPRVHRDRGDARGARHPQAAPRGRRAGGALRRRHRLCRRRLPWRTISLPISVRTDPVSPWPEGRGARWT